MSLPYCAGFIMGEGVGLWVAGSSGSEGLTAFWSLLLAIRRWEGGGGRWCGWVGKCSNSFLDLSPLPGWDSGGGVLESTSCAACGADSGNLERPAVPGGGLHQQQDSEGPLGISRPTPAYLSRASATRGAASADTLCTSSVHEKKTGTHLRNQQMHPI